MAKSLTHEFAKGLWSEIPPFRLVLGLCPTLAVTKAVDTGIGMGMATAFVLVFSNIMVAAMRKIIPPKVRIACFIIVIATFVTVIELLMQAYSYPMYLKLGIFTPLIVVNCILLGRAEAFASKNGIFASMLDGLGMGIGFTLSLASLGAVREILGTGNLTLGTDVGAVLAHMGLKTVDFWGKPIHVFPASFHPFSFMVQAPGAFVSLGLMLCIMNLIGKK